MKKGFEYSQGTGGPIIIWGMYPHRGNEEEHIIECINELGIEEDFTLAAFQVDKWNEQFSPWSHEVLDSSFAGQGIKTGKWLIEDYLPYIREKYGTSRPVYLMGYSLAGLFALWMLCESEEFAGALCCSGSLWYPDFVEYIRNNKPVNKDIYISLGGKEANTKDPLMASVGLATKEILEIVKSGNRVIFEQNSGGHFADSGKRLAKAIKWITEKRSK